MDNQINGQWTNRQSGKQGDALKGNGIKDRWNK